MLLSGTVALSRQVHGDTVEVTRTEQRGVYAGATQAYLGDRVAQRYPNSLRAVTDAEFFVLPAAEFGDRHARVVPDGDAPARRAVPRPAETADASSASGSGCWPSGSLSAGLTHELNNPAAAAVRATAVLRERIAGMRHKLAMIADGRLDGSQLRGLVDLQEEAVKRIAKAPRLTPMQTSDAEDALGDWLEEHGITGAGTSPRRWSPAASTGRGWNRWSRRSGRAISRARCAGWPTRSRPSC